MFRTTALDGVLGKMGGYKKSMKKRQVVTSGLIIEIKKD